MSWFKVIRTGIDILFVLFLYIISFGVLAITIKMVYDSGNYTSETPTVFNWFFCMVTFLFGCKIALICYDAYKEN